MSSCVAGSATLATESPLVKVSASASTTTSVPSSIGSGPVTRSAAVIRPSVTWCSRRVRRTAGSEVNAPNASAPSSSNAASNAASVGASTVTGPSPPSPSAPARSATSMSPESWLNSGSPATSSASESSSGSVTGGASLVVVVTSVASVESGAVAVVVIRSDRRRRGRSDRGTPLALPTARRPTPGRDRDRRAVRRRRGCRPDPKTMR